MTEAVQLFFKFQQLWQAGKDARLSMESHAGEAWINLHVYLPTPPQPPRNYRQQKRQPGPSRLRRRERRAAARTHTAEQAVVISETTEDNVEAVVVEEVTENVTEDSGKTITEEANKFEESNKETNSGNAGQAFYCDICERIFITEKGLKSHTGKMHKPSIWSPIPQIDGCIDENHVEYAFKSDYGEEDIEDSLNKIQDKTKASARLISRVRSSPLSAVHNCVVRITPVDSDSFRWPELEVDDAVVFSELVKIQ